MKFKIVKYLFLLLFMILCKSTASYANITPVHMPDINNEYNLKTVKFKGLRLECPDEYSIKKDDSNTSYQISGEVSKYNQIKAFTIDFLDADLDLNILLNKYLEVYKQYPNFEIIQKYDKAINSVDYKIVTFRIPSESIEGVFYFFKKDTKTIAFVSVSNIKGFYDSDETLSIVKSISTYNTVLYNSTNSSVSEYENDNERWSKSSSSYSNFKYGFHWKFDTKYKFDRKAGQVKHTVFRAETPLSDIIAFVNVQSFNYNISDIWSLYDKAETVFNMTKEKTFNDTGEIMDLKSITKCTLSGNHALKTIYTSRKKADDVHSTEETCTCIRYEFLRNSQLILVVVKFKNDYSIDSIKDIFKGFSFIP